MVAEKPSLASSLANILSNGKNTSRKGSVVHLTSIALHLDLKQLAYQFEFGFYSLLCITVEPHWLVSLDNWTAEFSKTLNYYVDYMMKRPSARVSIKGNRQLHIVLSSILNVIQ